MLKKENPALDRRGFRGKDLQQHRNSTTAHAHGRNPSDQLLPLLDGVKQTGAGRWVARCPAHEDKHPSLAIRELDDGRLLIHDFAGCSAPDVLSALGLTLADLFPAPLPDHRPLRPHERWVPRDVLLCLAGESLLVAIAAEAVWRGEVLGHEDRDRLALAAGRLRAGAREVGLEC